jgi:4'-phosphopantetheinyl transferase
MESRHCIEVWIVVLNEVPDALWPSAKALLDDAEQARAARFVFERHRRQYIAAHALKRLMLASLCGTPAPAWRFDIAPGGKPRVSDPAGPHFNLSHCEGLAACAVGAHTELGLDIEPVTRDAPFEIADRYFTPEEQRWLYSLPGSERATGFFRLWTLKEAFVKATGRGLAQPLLDISFGFAPLHVAFRDPALGNAAIWRFEQRVVHGASLLALAWHAQAGEASVAIREVRLEALLTR